MYRIGRVSVFVHYVTKLPNNIIYLILALNVKPIVSTTTNFPLQIGNKFYHVEDNLKTNWHQAAHNCRKLGGHLINFETNAEMDAILAAVPTSRYWTSANCLGKNREWISISTGMPMPFLKWINKEPNNMLELCVELKITALNDAFCNLSFNYICEAKVI